MVCDSAVISQTIAATLDHWVTSSMKVMSSDSEKKATTFASDVTMEHASALDCLCPN